MIRLPTILCFLLLLAPAEQTLAEDFIVASGDVAGLAAAVEAANSNNEEDDITLRAGVFTVLGSDANGEEFLRITTACL